MNFAINKTTDDRVLENYAHLIAREFIRKGHSLCDTKERINFVLNLADADSPKHYRRKSQDEFLVTLIRLNQKADNMKSVCFTTLIRTISNLVLCLVPDGDDTAADIYYITPEAGFVSFRFEPGRVYNCMLPIVGSHFVLGNHLKSDLPAGGAIKNKEITDLIYHAHELGKLGHLPVPFPLGDYLDEDMIRHVFRLYEIKGLSYGNLSVRNSDNTVSPSFWMTARGSDKAHLKQVGQDILLVTGYDDENHLMNVSVPPDHDPRIRVSVDAIEHFLIYSAYPDVGAIVHIHAWIDGIVCTTQNFPCGTYELAKSVSDLLKETKKPEQAEVGLKNHGITITGLNLFEIFDRIKGRIQVNVPMFE